MESSQPVTVNVRVGNILPLLSTALGRIYFSYLQTDQVAAMAEAERLAEHRTKSDIEEIAAATRARGLARIKGQLLPGETA